MNISPAYTILSKSVAVKDLRKGDKVLSLKTDAILTVTSCAAKDTKVIIVFNGDMEIDFPYGTTVTTVK